LAHLERYPYIYQHEDKIESLINAGYWIQANLGSFAGVYGEEYRKAAEYLLAEDYVHVLAGDCHLASDVEPCIVQGLSSVSKLLDSNVLELLTRENPARILGI
jgi:tyrosine-protein phosphatase YwqE